MARKYKILIFGMAIFLLIGHVASAQLINYNRRNKYLKARQDVKDGENPLPKWVEELPDVTNRFERRYDTNRDDRLQSAEVKVLLRDIIQRVEDRGRVEIESDILNEYDKNKDRMIEKFELERIRKDVLG